MYIKNNPIDCILEIFEKEYKDVKVTDIKFGVLDDDCFGLTNFADDGDVSIVINIDLPIAIVAEILSHELAHCVDVKRNGLPPVGEEHRDSWDVVFEELHAFYEDMIETFVANRK